MVHLGAACEMPIHSSLLQSLIRRRAREIGKSMKSIAVDAGVARSYLYKLANGQVQDPPIGILIRLANALKITPISIFRFYGDIGDQIDKQERLKLSLGIGVIDENDILAINSDITTPGHCVVKIGEEFDKIWEIQNIGKVEWRDRSLVRIDVPIVQPLIAPNAASLAAPVCLKSSANRISIPRIAPGNVARLKTSFVAPMANCSVASIWRIEDQFARPCYGPEFFLSAVVTVVHS